MILRPWPTIAASVLLLFCLGCEGSEAEDEASGSGEEGGAKAPTWVQGPKEGSAPLPAEVKGQWNFMSSDDEPKTVSIGATMIQGKFGYSDRNFANLKAVPGVAGPIPIAWQGVWFAEKSEDKMLFASSSTLLGKFDYTDKHYRFLEGSHANDVVSITSGAEDDSTVTGSLEMIDGVLTVSMIETASYGSKDTVAGRFVRMGHSGPKTQGGVHRIVEGVVDDDKAYGTLEEVGSKMMLSLVTQNSYSMDAYGGMVTRSAQKAKVKPFNGKSMDAGDLGENLFHVHAFDVPAVITLIKQGKHKDLSELEQVINDEKSGINNVDLDQDGKVDFIGIDESRDKKTIVLNFMAFPSSTPNDKASKTQVAEIRISPQGTATAKKAGDATAPPQTVQVTGQYPDYAKGHENSVYQSDWDTGDTAMVAGAAGGGLLLGYLLMKNRPRYGGYGYNHYRNRGMHRGFRSRDNRSTFFNRRNRFRANSGYDFDDDDDGGGGSRRKKSKLKKKNKKLKKKNKKLSKLVKKHKKKTAKARKSAAKAKKKASRSRARSVRKSSRSRGSRRGK